MQKLFKNNLLFIIFHTKFTQNSGFEFWNMHAVWGYGYLDLSDSWTIGLLFIYNIHMETAIQNL